MPKTKKGQTPSAKKATAPVVEVTPPEPVVAPPAHEEENVVTVSPLESLNTEFADCISEVGTLRSSLSTLNKRLKELQKRYDREMKTALKHKRKRTSNGQKRPSGFVKPTDITVELSKFLGKPKGTLMARTEVTRELNKYIREHKLQDPANGRKINPNAPLRKLLKVPDNEELTYFNLQKYMSPHFVKKNKSAAASSN
jgi:chromatin remodeling complex protein RSC6